MRRLFVFVAIVGGVLSGGGFAHATCCQGAGDCPRGFACLGGICDATVVNCTCDTDCGPDLFCIPAVATVCTQRAGTTTQECHPQGRCSSAWKRPCATDADCGPGGFTCVGNGQFCSTDGCQTTAMCKAPALPASCATDADCPATWTCEPDTALSTACVPDPPHSCPNGGCPPVTFTGAKSCLPPLFDLVGLGGFVGPPVVLPSSCAAKASGGTSGVGGVTGNGGASPAGGGGTHSMGGATGGGGIASSGGATGSGGAVSAGGAIGSGGSASSGGGTGSGGAVSAGGPAAGASGAAPQPNAANPTRDGCQMAPGSHSAPALLVSALALLGAGARRRTKRPEARPASRR